MTDQEFDKAKQFHYGDCDGINYYGIRKYWTRTGPNEVRPKIVHLGKEYGGQIAIPVKYWDKANKCWHYRYISREDVDFSVFHSANSPDCPDRILKAQFAQALALSTLDADGIQIIADAGRRKFHLELRLGTAQAAFEVYVEKIRKQREEESDAKDI